MDNLDTINQNLSKDDTENAQIADEVVEDEITTDEVVEDEITAEEGEAEVVTEDSDKSKEASWYVVHTYSTREKIVKQNLESMIENNALHDQILEISIPSSEDIVERDGKRKVVERKKLPGYVFIKAILSDKILYIIKNTKGITGFVGPSGKALPLSDDEVKRLGLEKISVDELKVKPGDNVKIVSGPLESFLGVVDSVSAEKEKIKVIVHMFGRETPVDLEFHQVELIH